METLRDFINDLEDILKDIDNPEKIPVETAYCLLTDTDVKDLEIRGINPTHYEGKIIVFMDLGIKED